MVAVSGASNLNYLIDLGTGLHGHHIYHVILQVLRPADRWRSFVSLLKHLLSNENPHSHFHPVYQPPECCLFPSHTLAMSDAVNCGSGGGDDSSFGLRIASVFIILVGSMAGALFPVLAKRSSWLHVPKPIFELVLKSFILPWHFFIHVVNSHTQHRQILWFRSYCTVWPPFKSCGNSVLT